VRIIRLDGSPEAVASLAGAVAEALDGGPAVLPLGEAAVPPLNEAAVLTVGDAAAAPARVHAPDTANHPDQDIPPAPPSARVRTPGTANHPTHDTPGADPGGVLVATSGSTGRPRLVVLPPAALRASATATAARLGGPGRWLLALPADHVAGVQVVVRALLAGAPPVVQDLRGGFRPAGFAAATARLGPGQRYTSLVPTQLLRLLDAGGTALDALVGYDAVLVGGAAVDAGLRARAEAAGVRVVVTYGMTETAGGCVYDGVPLDGVRVRLVETRDGDGRIVVGGPTLAAGYLDDPVATAATFVEGEFRTSDLGRWIDGRLEVLGRVDDVIVTGGANVAPAAVERVLAAQPGVRAACVVGLPDPEWGAVVAAALVVEGAPALDELRAAVYAALGRAAVPRVLRTVDALPLRGIGKPDRAAVADLLITPSIHTLE
jgi:O-succinylbenzoic acid--CoA ligase